MQNLIKNYLSNIKHINLQQIPKGNFSLQQKVNSYQELEQQWNDFSESYTDDYSPSLSPLTITMLNMLEIEKSKTILETGVGSGYQIPYLMMKKRPDAQLYLTDLSQNLLSITANRIDLFLQNKLDQVYNFNLKELQPYQNAIEFKEQSTVVKQANSEQLSDFKDNSIDSYISSLCLQLTTDPKNMVQEAFRVLSPGGKACFSVWGDKERSAFMNMIPLICKQNNIQLPNARSNFHLNDREQLIKLFQEVGFTNILCWDQFVPISSIKNEEEAEKFVDIFIIKQQLADIVPEEQLPEIKLQIIQAFKERVTNQKLSSGLDALIILASKPQ